jgi:hypothetical protein
MNARPLLNTLHQESDGVILVFYVNVGNASVAEATEMLNSTKEEVEDAKRENDRFFFVPIRDGDSQIDCIYPKVISEQSEIDNFNNLMDRLDNLLNERTIMTIDKPNKFYIKSSKKL